MIALEQFINFAGPEWNAIRIWLKESQENKIGLLVGEVDHDQSNKLRGALSVIRELLKLEDAAKMAANQRI